MATQQYSVPLYDTRKEITRLFDELVFDISSSEIDNLKDSTPMLLLQLISGLDNAESLKNFIPPPPNQLLVLIEILGAKEPNISEVEDAIKVDIGLIGEMVRIANSPLYRPKFGEVTSLNHAINMLGLETVATIASTVIMRRTMNFQDPLFQQLATKQWEYCLRCAEACQIMTKPSDKFKSYILGLTHNTGAVALIGYCEQSLAKIKLDSNLKMAIAHHLIRYKATVISSRIATEWNLPTQFSSAIKTFGELVSGTLRHGDYQSRTPLVKTLELGSLVAQVYMLYKAEYLPKEVCYAGVMEYGLPEVLVDKIFTRFQLAEANVL